MEEMQKDSVMPKFSDDNKSEISKYSMTNK